MQWQGGIFILGVQASVYDQDALIFFRNVYGIVGWRRVQSYSWSRDGVANVVTVASMAQLLGKPVWLLLSNAGDILGIATL